MDPITVCAGWCLLEVAQAAFVGGVAAECGRQMVQGASNSGSNSKDGSSKGVNVEVNADFGVAFDGDFDRCFFFDSSGKFVQGEYIVGLLANIFLEKEYGATVAHDTRIIWNTQDIILGKGGTAVPSKTGHVFVKRTMRKYNAIYGGETSAHHYFRDFAYCDSGMIPWLLIAELVSKSGRSLSNWIHDRFQAFPSSGEINFHVDDASISIDRVLDAYGDCALSLDKTDGVSLEFNDWRFNLRQSNTEPLVRLNVESRGSVKRLTSKVTDISKLIGGVIV